MPTYDVLCERQHRFDRVIPLAQFGESQYCDCGSLAVRQIGVPLLVRASEDVRYTSPVDGRVITSRDAHREDLKRNNCIPYDPEVRTDYARRKCESDAVLTARVSETVERTIEQMPTPTRARLYADLTLNEGVSHG